LLHPALEKLLAILPNALYFSRVSLSHFLERFSLYIDRCPVRVGWRTLEKTIIVTSTITTVLLLFAHRRKLRKPALSFGVFLGKFLTRIWGKDTYIKDMNVVFEPVGIGEYLENFKNNSNNNSNNLYTSDDEREEERLTTTTKDEDKEEKKFKIGQQNQHLEAEFYALKVRNEVLEQSLSALQTKENVMSIELEHFMRERVERDAVIERLKMELETSCSNTIRKEEERKALLREMTKKLKKMKKAKKRTFEESLRLLEKATSALELAKAENESLRAKLKEEKTLKTTTKKKKKTKKKETEQKRRRRERLRTTTPLPETPQFAKQFWSYRNDERRRLHEENKVHHHPLQFSDDDDDDSDSDDDDFYSDEDTSSSEEESSSSSSESSSSASEEDDDDDEEEYQRDATNNTSYSSIDELLDRSVVLNTRLEALERRARNLVALENAKPSAKADRDDKTTE